MDAKIRVECSDVMRFPCDVLVLKHAQDFYGADALVADMLGERQHISLRSGEHVLLPSEGKIAAKYVLFVGVPGLYRFRFGYDEIREFAYRSMRILYRALPNVESIAMTIHGVGYGLDEVESFLAQMVGLLEALHDELVPSSLSAVTIVEKDPFRAERLKQVLDANFPEATSAEN